MFVYALILIFIHFLIHYNTFIDKSNFIQFKLINFEYKFRQDQNFRQFIFVGNIKYTK